MSKGARRSTSQPQTAALTGAPAKRRAPPAKAAAKPAKPESAPRSPGPAPRSATVFVDARTLQDERYRERGIGHHVSTLLRGRDAASPISLVGVIDPALPPLGDEAELFDRVQTAAYTRERAAGLLVPSPMTHSPLPFAPMLNRSGFSAALVYDFIPMDHPGTYLADADTRLSYLSRLLWLKRFSRFYAISDHTRTQLGELLHVDDARIVTSGIAVRDGLAGAEATASRVPAYPYFAVPAGDDWRKNVEAPVLAHARSTLLARQGVKLVILGGYPLGRMAELRALHAGAGGRAELLVFKPKVPDAELRALYGGAIATVAPSRAEGFSLPVLEAAVCGCPVIASDCAAQKELIDDPDDLFAPDDLPALQFRMETLFLRPDVREDARRRQAGLAERFSQAAVRDRFWSDFTAQVLAHAGPAPAAAPAVGRRARPTLALATPMPPSASGVATFSEAALAELVKIADVTVYTETQDPQSRPGAGYAVEALSAIPYLSNRFDATVSVVGNSHYHSGIFDHLMSWGSATIAHDARMLNFYAVLLGEERALRVLRSELKRDVSPAEMHGWLGNQAELEALLLDEIAAVSRPLMLHSAVTAGLLRARGTETVLLPFSPYHVLPDAAFAKGARSAARERLGIPKDAFVVATFGNLLGDRALEDCLGAVEMLRAWNIPAFLVCIGPYDPAIGQYLRNVANLIGMGPFLRLTGAVARPVYESWLQAADAGVQLRTYKLGGLSGALLDCTAAALPTVANEHLAEAMNSPAWVRRVPDAISGVLIAEQLAAIRDEGAGKARRLAERQVFLEERGFRTYARQMLEALGLDAAA